MGSFGDLLKAKGMSASEVTDAPVEAPVSTPGDEVDWAAQTKVVLRMERKGRGGKTVTLVQQIAAPAEALEKAAKALRKAMGTQARREDADIVVQGDQRDRLQVWLQGKGVRRVVV